MNILENLLVTLMEECAEVQKAASKILRAGPDSNINGTRPTTNLEELFNELQDLYGTVAELAENGLDIGTYDPAMIEAKQKKLRHFIAVSRSLGFVQGPKAYKEPEL